MFHYLASDPFAGHTFIQWVSSWMIQLQQLFIHFAPKRKGSVIPWSPKAYRSHVKALYSLMQWFLAHPRSGCPSGTICAP